MKISLNFKINIFVHNLDLYVISRGRDSAKYNFGQKSIIMPDVSKSLQGY